MAGYFPSDISRPGSRSTETHMVVGYFPDIGRAHVAAFDREWMRRKTITWHAEEMRQIEARIEAKRKEHA